jgi:hypothetical protein
MVGCQQIMEFSRGAARQFRPQKVILFDSSHLAS